MRRSLVGVALAVTSLVALAFLLPLGVLVYTQAREQRITAAEQRAAALAPMLTLTTDGSDLLLAISGLDSTGNLGVHLPDGDTVGAAAHASPVLLERASRERGSIATDLPDGWLYLQPVVLPHDQVAVIEAFVPRAELTQGVAVSWAVMSLLAVGLIVGSVVVADRLGAQVVRSSRQLSKAADALGAGDLQTRVDPSGPPELHRVGDAFNVLAERMVRLLAVERELVADLSHRLRTPLTALHLAADRLGPTPEAQHITSAVDQLEAELRSIIAAARTPLATSPMGQAFADPQATPGGRAAEAVRRANTVSCEAGEAVRQQAGFWAVLAEQQGRDCSVAITTEPTPVALPADDVVAVVDALVGNVFGHTPAGTALAIRLARTAQSVVLEVEDAGPGIPDVDGALTRGGSTGSTGLGLDIALRATTATQGGLRITRGPMGGALITVTLGLATPPARAVTARRRRR
ncbi:HAMP domain-containing sensor histidine kinase [Kitasatospora nipponensis]|uniref:histidine kinase n=1 Tax=Kitasatospora nipponensis TaxID=258049 RepID=A0ABP4DSD8_9ACTN